MMLMLNTLYIPLLFRKILFSEIATATYILFQFQLNIRTITMFSFKAQFVLFITYLFIISVVDARFKIPWPKKSSTSSSSSSSAQFPAPPSLLSESRPSTSFSQSSGSALRRRPQHASYTSLTEIELYSKSLSGSSSSLNRGNSPAIMRESLKLHEQAAKTLNIQTPGIKPKFHNYKDYLQKLGSYAKNGGIALGAVGGAISVGESLSTAETVNNITHIHNTYIINNVTTIRPQTTTNKIRVSLPQ